MYVKNFNFGEGSWTSINSGLTGNGAWVAPVDEDQNLGNHLYTSTSAGIFRTTAGGNPWVNVASHTVGLELQSLFVADLATAYLKVG